MYRKTAFQLLVCAALFTFIRDFLIHYVVLHLGWDSPFLSIAKVFSNRIKRRRDVVEEDTNIVRDATPKRYQPTKQPSKALSIVAPTEKRNVKLDKGKENLVEGKIEERAEIVTPCTPQKEWKEVTHFEAPPDSEECSSVTSNGTDGEMSKRTKKNRKRKIPMQEFNEERKTSPISVIIPKSFKDSSLGAMFSYLRMTENELYQKLVPLCAQTEVRILNGFPYETTQGAFVFKPFGISTLNAALAGKQLVDAEIEDNVENLTNFNFKNTPNKNRREDSPTYSIEPLNLCIRCHKQFSTKCNGLTTCYYHSGKATIRKDGVLRYTCCNGLKNNNACCTHKFHLFHHLQTGLNGPLEGFLSAQNKRRCKRIFGLDCEMVYTDRGFEVARVTLVSVQGAVVLDCYVKPEGKVYDFVTQFSGITAAHLQGAVSFKKMRYMLLNHIGKYDIIVGHSLEGDLHVLKLIHRRVIDTSIMFSVVQNGMAIKQSLRNLSKQNLQKDIQKSSSGHNSIEDASMAVSLLLHSLLSKMQSVVH